MSIAIEPVPVPLQADDTGSLRVRGTRVTLDTVIGAFSEGASAEEIAQQYPAIALADVYAIIAYYLTHQQEVEEYLAAQARQSAEIRAVVEADPTTQIIRERLRARQAPRE